MRTVFAPYNLRVSATRELARMFDSICIRPEGSRFRPRYDDLIVNWGRSDLPDYPVGRVLNHPDAVSLCVNKLRSFSAFEEHGVPCVPWTQYIATAKEWHALGEIVVGRASLAGRGGQGIRMITPQDPDMPDLPLYTKYMKRKHEYRVHVMDGKVIDVQQKKLRNGVEKNDLTYKIRSYANGWIFAREGVVCPEAVQNAAIAAVRSLGLDFGGVDVGWNETAARAYVYEVNSAPGIEGTTVENYTAALRRI